MSKGNTHPLLVGIQTCTTTLKISMAVSQKLGINLPQDPAIPLLGIYPKYAQSYYKDICSTMFIAALFLINRNWKQPRCPTTKEWIKKMWHIYTLEYYSELKKQWHLEICTEMYWIRKHYPEWRNQDPKIWI